MSETIFCDLRCIWCFSFGAYVLNVNSPSYVQLGFSHVLKECPTTSSSQRRATAVGGAGARSAMLGSGNLDPGVYPAAGPCSSTSLQRHLGSCHGL